MPAETYQFSPTADRLNDLRRAFGCYGTGVTVITTNTSRGPLGITANSFSSVSLDPALILWSPAISSRRHDAFATAKSFCVHVLGAHQLDLARHFSTEGEDFDAFDWSHGPSGAPCLSGCLAEFHCDTHAVHPAGDHSVIIGEVRQVVQHGATEPGLLFERGAFGRFVAQE
ncbi:flavin reductase family protein [Roseobacter sp. EG26]|uniref:flavin reductase family protein n=1 Tax=Roseobacter sp. EG26 TaxID=3412477 RepID=UPI003CE53A71